MEQDQQPSSQPLFLHVPVSRVIAMSIVSMGLYNAYWIYKNYRYVKERERSRIWPFWRGIFGFFLNGHMSRVRGQR